MTPPIAFVDCETTGVHPGRRPWEIAIIRREPDDTEYTSVIQIEDVQIERSPGGSRALWRRRIMTAFPPPPGSAASRSRPFRPSGTREALPAWQRRHGRSP